MNKDSAVRAGEKGEKELEECVSWKNRIRLVEKVLEGLMDENEEIKKRLKENEDEMKKFESIVEGAERNKDKKKEVGKETKRLENKEEDMTKDSDNKKEKVDTGEEKLQEKEGKTEEKKDLSVLIRKGKRSGEIKFKEWLEKSFKGKWKLEMIGQNMDIRKLILENEEDLKFWMDRREVARKKGYYIIEELLTVGERRNRFKMLEEARAIEEFLKKKGMTLDIKKEDKRIIIEGKPFKWDEEKEKMRPSKTE